MRLLLLAGAFVLNCSAFAEPLALIYKGPGSCEQSSVSGGCSEAAALAAQKAGFKTQYVGPNENVGEEKWRQAAVWIQPGGRARVQILTMSAKLVGQIRDFVSKGGGYVGFCAGMFLAADKFGWVDEEDPKNSFESAALGLISGYGYYFDEYDKELSEDHLAKILKVSWADKSRYVYWELGPYFDRSVLKDKRYSVIANYTDSKGKPRSDRIMTLQGTFGSGRVSLTAVHPEAPEDWRSYYKITDPDGLDIELASDMIKWAARH